MIALVIDIPVVARRTLTLGEVAITEAVCAGQIAVESDLVLDRSRIGPPIMMQDRVSRVRPFLGRRDGHRHANFREIADPVIRKSPIAANSVLEDGANSPIDRFVIALMIRRIHTDRTRDETHVIPVTCPTTRGRIVYTDRVLVGSIGERELVPGDAVDGDGILHGPYVHNRFEHIERPVRRRCRDDRWTLLVIGSRRACRTNDMDQKREQQQLLH